MRDPPNELRRLSGLDSVFLSAETAANPLHMMGLVVLDPSTVPGGYDFAQFRELFASRLLLAPPLRRRLVEVPFGLGRPYWIDDSEMKLDYHLRRTALPSPGTPEQLAAMASEMNEGTLPRDRPLWQLRIVEGLEGGNVAILAKLHHAMMDGTAGVKFMSSLFSRTPELPPLANGLVRLRRQRAPEPRALIERALGDLTRRPWQIGRAAATSLARAVSHGRGREGRSDRLATPQTVFNGRAGPERRAAYLTAPLSSVRDLAAAADATVNDVLLALVAGGLRRTLEIEQALPDEPLVAGVPVSIHDEDDDRSNAYSAIFASLHTDEPDPIARLYAIRDGAKAAKAVRAKRGGSPLDAWADIPLPLEVSVVTRIYTRLSTLGLAPALCNCIVSNVPGPRTPLYLAGLRVVGIHPLGPIVDSMTLNVTVLSREDALDFGIVAGTDAPRDLWTLARAIPEELDILCKAWHLQEPASHR